MRFTLYDLDPAFWERVKAKAEKESTTVKALILKLLAQWLGIILLALVFNGCSGMTSPTAPSTVLPPTSSTRAPLPATASFTVSLTNGTDPSATFAGNTWSGFLSVQAVGVAVVSVPAALTIDCGDGSTQRLTPGVGLGIRVTCFFATAGTYTVRGTVEAINSVTTSAALAVVVKPVPADQTPVSVNITAVLTDPEFNGTANQLWTLTPTVTGPVSELMWNFGDGHAGPVTGPRQVLTHVYGQAGIYTIVVTPRRLDGTVGLPGQTQILVNCSC